LSQREYFHRMEKRGKLPFFNFIAIEENYAAARGRSGGLALWRRIDQ